jgi:hypothetical protein
MGLELDSIVFICIFPLISHIFVGGAFPWGNRLAALKYLNYPRLESSIAYDWDLGIFRRGVW